MTCLDYISFAIINKSLNFQFFNSNCRGNECNDWQGEWMSPGAGFLLVNNMAEK